MTRKNNGNLGKAQISKQDEFYTGLSDISSELEHYREQLRGKTIFCNCDDPMESNFFKYFAVNFNALGLKKLIATNYVHSALSSTGLSLFSLADVQPQEKQPYAIEITKVPEPHNDDVGDIYSVGSLLNNPANTANLLIGDEGYGAGDFRSRECIELLKQSDIVITNPPFSLFRKYVAQMVKYEKQFLVLGNMNAVTYKEVFPLFQNNQMWYGPSIRSGDREFRVPDDYPITAAGSRVDEYGNKYVRVKGVRWFTNLDYLGRHEDLDLQRAYCPSAYPKYANCDAIEVSKTMNIPFDYDGLMGVPITFLDKYNPRQFDILGSPKTLGQPMSQIAKKGTYQQGGPRFCLPNGDGTYRGLYCRIVIRRTASG